MHELILPLDEHEISKAAREVGSLPGVETATALENSLSIRYNFADIQCAAIVECATRYARLNATVWQTLRLWLRCYREGVQREDLNNEMGWDSFVREIYVSRYRHRRHGRRDDRARHWRQYGGPPKEREPENNRNQN